MLQLISEKSKNHYYEQLYVNKLDNTEEMNRFLETYNLPRLNHKGTENLDFPGGAVVKNTPATAGDVG